MQGAREHIGPVVLLAEFYSSGGTRTYLKQILNFYSALKVKVLLVSQYERLDEEIADLVNRLGFEYQSYSSVLGSEGHRAGDAVWLRPWSIRRQLTERRAFANLVSRVDACALVVSVGTPGLFAGASGASSRSLYILHTYPHGRRQKYLGRWFMGWLFRRTRHFLAVSEYQKTVMKRIWHLEARSADIHVVPNTAGPVPTTKCTWTYSNPIILTASWVEPYKEPRDWLEIARNVSATRTPPARFVWFGEGSELECMQEVARLSVTNMNAEFRGHQDDMESAYAGATVYLQMSSTENMSLSVLDAMRWGLPSVVTDVGGLPEIVTSDECGYIVPVHDVQRASDMIRRLLEDEVLWMQMSLRARERYEQKFSPDVWFQAMKLVHDWVVNGVSAPGETELKGEIKYG